MKKKIFIFFLILLLIITLKYFTSDYKITYNLDNHKVVTTYKNKRYYITIDDKYGFDIYKKRELSRLKIKSIEDIKSDYFECVYPKIKNIDTKPLCYYKDEYVDYNLIDSELLNDYKIKTDSKSEGNFYFNDNLDKNEYVYLWNYKGFYKMNDKKLETLELFNKGKYDNSLMYQADNYILLPNYNQEYYFNKLYLINMINGKSNTINFKYEISYNSYIIGEYNNRVYLFDQKESKLYEINIKSLKIKLVGSDELGYFKYENGKKVDVKVSEYKNKEISYNNELNSYYKYEIEDNKIYKTYLDNNLKIKIFEGNNLKIIDEYKNTLYFASEDNFYKYTPISKYKLFNYFELNFNENKIIYIFNQ